jgi:glyceraldehyde 3-phosphate dehydrogenase
VLPALEGRLNGMAIRVPTPNVSLVDLVFTSERPMTAAAINAAITEAADGDLKGILKAETKPIVSGDLIGNTHSSIFDLEQTLVSGEYMAKVLSWYDNEWGFANRMIDLTRILSGLARR